jgi:hypothetical protein
MEINMSFFTRLFSASTRTAYMPFNGQNLTTEMERRRLSGTMPGETGARAGSRFGIML